ncbi:MAG TPA: 4Fe-4S binding protein [Dehalococcoidia bacterium]|nr:4Fe-4S binding protein [Dehalococcoidia bacterium]
MHNEITKALYEMFPEDEKNDFYHAYIFLKYPDHFVYHLSQAGGLPAERPQTKLDDDVDAMIQAAVWRISETAATHDTSTYHLKVVKLRDAIQLVTQKADVRIKTPDRVMHYKQARDIIINNPHSIAVGECACRAISKNPCLPPPMEVCLFVGDPYTSFIAEENPKFRKISQEEAVHILQTSHEKGFLHTAEFKKELGRRLIAICNCCSCCCVGVQMWNILEGQVPFIAPSGYVSRIGDNCSGCGICLDICNFNAIRMDEDSNKAVVDFNKCMGCGICEDKCPDGAITLQRESSKGDPLDLEELLRHQK